MIKVMKVLLKGKAKRKDKRLKSLNKRIEELREDKCPD